jgi:4-amino-4-deoxy-L-arabinose transferase-like glycosyltransferase
VEAAEVTNVGTSSALAVAGVILALRLPNLISPMNRDSGFYAYIGQRMSAGDVLYRDIWDNHTPGLPFVNAVLFRLFSDTFFTIQVFEILMAGVHAVVMYSVARFLYSRGVALAATLLYTFCLNSSIQSGGNMTEFYMTLPLVVAWYGLMRYHRDGKVSRLFLAGGAAGVAFLFKQSAVWSMAGVAVFCLWREWGTHARIRRAAAEVAAFAAGVLVVVAGLFAVLAVYGALGPFFKYVVFHNYYVEMNLGPLFTVTTFRRLFWSLADQMFVILAPLLFLGAVAAVDILRGQRAMMGGRDLRWEIRLLACWALCDAFGVFITRLNYPHYYVPILAPLALLAGYTLQRWKDGSDARDDVTATATVVALALFIAMPVIVQARYTVRLVKDRVISHNRSLSEVASDFVKVRSSEGSRVWVWGADPMVNFLSKRPSPSRYPLIYPLQSRNHAGPSDIQELLDDLTRKRPQFIVDASGTNEWVFPLLEPKNGVTGETDQVAQFMEDRFDPVRDFVRSHYAERARMRGWVIYEAVN